MKPHSHFIFDFDGTIADTENIFAQFDCTLLNNVLRRENISYTLTIEEVRALAGNNDVSKLEIIAKRFNFNPEDQKEEFLKERAQKRNILFKNTPAPLAKNVKTFIKRLDGKCAIATNKSGKRLHMDLKTMELDNLFDIIVTCDPPLKKKPAPDMLLEAAKKLNIPPESCAYIGDNTLDMEATKNANMTPIGFIIEGIKENEERKNALAQAGATMIIDDFADLIPYIIEP